MIRTKSLQIFHFTFKQKNKRRENLNNTKPKNLDLYILKKIIIVAMKKLIIEKNVDSKKII